jgi:hypothetical protein
MIMGRLRRISPKMTHDHEAVVRAAAVREEMPRQKTHSRVNTPGPATTMAMLREVTISRTLAWPSSAHDHDREGISSLLGQIVCLEKVFGIMPLITLMASY